MMGDMTTIARPYAIAAFEYAMQKNVLPAWEGMLRSAALLAEQKIITQLLSSPAVTKAKLVTVFCDILSSVLDTAKQNFIYLLAENNRLAVLPDMAELFASYRAEYEKNITVQIVSAVDLSEKYQHTLAARLTKRLARQVTLQCKVDPTLIGGVIVRAGDKVIDGSVRGKLNRLLESL
jgi:F-type H+-transporting ATPase subunit delta